MREGHALRASGWYSCEPSRQKRQLGWHASRVSRGGHGAGARRDVDLRVPRGAGARGWVLRGDFVCPAWRENLAEAGVGVATINLSLASAVRRNGLVDRKL